MGEQKIREKHHEIEIQKKEEIPVRGNNNKLEEEEKEEEERKEMGVWFLLGQELIVGMLSRIAFSHYSSCLFFSLSLP